MTKQSFAGERYIWIAAVVLLAGFCLNLNSKRIQTESELRRRSAVGFNVADIRQRAEVYSARAEMLARELETLKSKLAMYDANLKSGQVNATPHLSPLDERELRELKVHGLSNPESDLVADLRRHPELIPKSGSQRGTMRFYDPAGIRILNTHWALAGFDDGHVSGRALLKYRFVRHGEVEWQLVDSFVD